jgi:hypothetical protein
VAETDLFKWRHYESEIILLRMRWYLRYALSYRDLEEMNAAYQSITRRFTGGFGIFVSRVIFATQPGKVTPTRNERRRSA